MNRTPLERIRSHVESELDRIARARSKGLTETTARDALNSAQISLFLIEEQLREVRNYG